MKKVFKVLLVIVGLLLLVVIAGLSYIKLALPNVGEPQEITINHSEKLVKQGEYLANNVMVCMDCHSERDWTKFSAPLVEGTLGKGGEVFDQNLGFPGVFISKNITPYALSSWTDEEIFHTITTGVSKNGDALFPVMPYSHYGKLDQKDVEAIIAYLRTLPSIEAENKKSVPDFPMNFIINTIPKKAELVTKPDASDRIAYGKYMVNAAACYDCHTKQEKGQFIGEDFAGGMEFRLHDGSVVRSLNITPHETGLGKWTEEQFVGLFKSYVDSGYVPSAVEKGSFQTVMPWVMYGGMKEEDLKAMYAYLMTLEPVDNTVIRFTSSME